MRVSFSIFMGVLTCALFIVSTEGMRYMGIIGDKPFLETYEPSKESLENLTNWIWFVFTTLFFICALCDQDGRKYRNKAECCYMFVYALAWPLWLFQLLKAYGIFHGSIAAIEAQLSQVYKYGTFPYWLATSVIINVWLIMQCFNSNQMTREQYKKEILRINT